MADENTAAHDAEQAKAAEASFDKDAIPQVAETAKAGDEVKAEPAAAEPTPAAAPPVPVERPRYAKVLQTDLDNLKAAAGKVASLESAVARLTGTVGNTAQLEQRIIEKVRSLTPAGLSVEMSEEDFAELAAEYPEIARSTRSALEKVFKKAGVRGTGEATTPPLRDEDLDKGVERALQKRELTALTKAYPEWSKIVGVVDETKGEKPDESNEFRRWLATQPDDYQKEINTTNSFADVRSALDRFTASKTAAPTQSATPDRAAARRAIMENAVTPRTDGSPPMLRNPAITAEEAFLSAKPLRPH